MNARGRRFALMLAVVVSTICATSACYTFAPVAEPLPLGSNVRAVLTADEAIRVSERTGQVAREYEGRLTDAADDSISMAVVTMRIASEVASSNTFRQTVSIPRDELEELSVRQLSAWRTGVVATLAAAGVYLILTQVRETGGNTDMDDGGNPPRAPLVPIIRIPTR